MEALWKQEGAKRCEYLASREKKPRQQAASKALKRCEETNSCESFHYPQKSWQPLPRSVAPD